MIEKKDIKLITVLNIVFGPGITWVNPKEKRTYNKQFGDKYFSEPLVLPIGRRKTIIVRLTMGGYGQGVSTIIGSWLGLVYNLQLPSHLETEEYVACDNLQLTNRLILNNFFWEGPFGLNIIYSNYYNEESRYFRRPIITNPLDYYNPKKNSFQYSEKWHALTSEKQTEIINRFIQHRKVELIISNLWVEMAQPNPKSSSTWKNIYGSK